MLERQNISRRDFLRGALAVGGAALVAGATTEGARAASVAPTAETTLYTAPATLFVARSVPGIDFTFAEPGNGDWSATGDVKNKFIGVDENGNKTEPEEGSYFHPKSVYKGKVQHWSYKFACGYRSNPDMESRQHGGEEGKWYIRQGNEDAYNLAVAVACNEQYAGDWGNNPSLNWRSHPDTDVYFGNPVNGQLYEKDGKPMVAKTSESGDLLIRVATSGRLALVTCIPKDIGLENYLESADRDSNYAINEIDLREVMAGAAGRPANRCVPCN